MDDLFDEMADDAEKSLDLPEDGQLGTVAKIAEQILAQEQLVKNLGQEHQQAKDKLLALKQEELPTIMAELNLSSFSLQDGSQVTLKPISSGRIKEDDKARAFAWLREHGSGDLIKNTVTVTFNREQDNEAKALVADLEEKDLKPKQKSEIHPQTLQAWVKERIAEGKPLDMELFNVWVGQRAEIKRK